MYNIAGMALIASLGVKNYKLDQALSGDQVFVHGVGSHSGLDENGREEYVETTPHPSINGAQEKGSSR
jgi:hypothetical protein